MDLHIYLSYLLHGRNKNIIGQVFNAYVYFSLKLALFGLLLN